METGRRWWRILESQSLRQRNGCGEKEGKKNVRREDAEGEEGARSWRQGVTGRK